MNNINVIMVNDDIIQFCPDKPAQFICSICLFKIKQHLISFAIMFLGRI